MDLAVSCTHTFGMGIRTLGSINFCLAYVLLARNGRLAWHQNFELWENGDTRFRAVELEHFPATLKI
jgi:hypothetical protein